MRQLSAYVSRQVAGCKDGPCPNWYELASGDYMFQGDELHQADGLNPLPGQTLVRVPRALVREGIGEVDAMAGENTMWVELDADNLAFLGDRIDDAAVLAGIDVSPGEVFIRVDRTSITTALAEAA
jgi:hypothetical protein